MRSITRRRNKPAKPALLLHRPLSEALWGHILPEMSDGSCLPGAEHGSAQRQGGSMAAALHTCIRTLQALPRNTARNVARRGCSFSECVSHAYALSRQAMLAGPQRGRRRISKALNRVRQCSAFSSPRSGRYASIAPFQGLLSYSCSSTAVTQRSQRSSCSGFSPTVGSRFQHLAHFSWSDGEAATTSDGCVSPE